ncbi:MAG TPA: hypothetical protein VFQ53_17340 [Kofleriaceae bacterium]|nr:hypothetical protein [Kofleriaceae bacterium]
MKTLSLALIVVAAVPALAAPAGWTSGWTIESRGRETLYRPEGHAEIELRVHAAEPTSDPAATWFQSRRRRAPTGVTLVRDLRTEERSGVQIGAAMGERDRAPVFVVSLGCRAGTAMVYAELITPQRAEDLQTYTPAAAEIALQSCLSSLPQPAATPDAPPPPPVKKPGAGLKPSQIAGILYSWQYGYSGTSLNVDETIYLLLADGTVRRTLPKAAPDEFDVEADRQETPKAWGRWKKQGSKYLVSIQNSKFFEPEGAMMRKPGKPNERLDGTYEASSSSSIGTISTWSTRSITFTRDGRFSRSSSGGGGSTSTLPGEVAISQAYDDEGSSVAISGPNVGGGSRRKSGSTKADREGSYKIDGYVLELRYDSGRIERMFFALRDDRKTVLLGNSELHKPSK